MRTDPEIRALLLPRLAAERPAALVVQEWKICESSIVDVATVTPPRLDGYEIKGAADSLARLPGQVVAYGKVFDSATLVCAPKWVAHAVAFLPAWWGITVARDGVLTVEREAGANPAVDALTLLHLLWVKELSVLARRVGLPRYRSKGTIIEALRGTLAHDDIRREVRGALLLRADWRNGEGRSLVGERMRAEEARRRQQREERLSWLANNT